MCRGSHGHLGRRPDTVFRGHGHGARGRHARGLRRQPAPQALAAGRRACIAQAVALCDLFLPSREDLQTLTGLSDDAALLDWCHAGRAGAVVPQAGARGLGQPGAASACACRAAGPRCATPPARATVSAATCWRSWPPATTWPMRRIHANAAAAPFGGLRRGGAAAAGGAMKPGQAGGAARHPGCSPSTGAPALRGALLDAQRQVLDERRGDQGIPCGCRAGGFAGRVRAALAIGL